MRLSIINSDLFNISKRIKSIDKNYFIVRNNLKNRFEVHYKRSCNTLELVLPFECLDVQTINLVLKSKIENRKKLIKEMEKENEKILKEQTENAKKMLKECLE